MHDATIERILSCQQLPSLPAVAARVIELTSNDDVDMRDLASTIQHDQALTAKVLRTINSSFFGLRNKCSSIDQALVMLGLSAVKSLALGFSLVDTLSARELDGFDYVAFWRRGIYSAVGARAIGRHRKATWADDAFLSALLQDIGVIAMYQALGSDYAEVVAGTRGDHRKLVRRELSAFEVQHPEAGAMLAERWRLPDDVVLAVRYHERPTAAPEGAIERVKAIALGNAAHDVLTDEDTIGAFVEFEREAADWFNIDSDGAVHVLREIAGAVTEVARLFALETGDSPDVERILETAGEEMVNATRRRDAPMDELLLGDQGNDALTGFSTRAIFDEEVDALLEHAKQVGDAFAVVVLGIDAYEGWRAEQGPESCDRALLEARDAVEENVAAPGATMARYAEDMIGVTLPGADREMAESFATTVRASLATVERADDADAPESTSVSIGIVCVEPERAAVYKSGASLQAAAMRALDAARVAGGNCERTFVARAAA